MSYPILNCFYARGRGGLRARKRAVADLKLDDVFALGLEPFGNSQDIERGLRPQPLSEATQVYWFIHWF
jgi:hypothetical protein